MKLNPPTLNTPWGYIQKSVGSLTKTDPNSIINYVEFSITGRCNGGCITCPNIDKYKDEKDKKTIMDLSEEEDHFKSILLKLKKYGMNVLTIYGREPTLWDSESKKLVNDENYFLKDLINWISNELSIKVCLCTSGLNLNENLLKNLFENDGILFMKNWGSKKSYQELMQHKNAFKKSKESWKLVNNIKKEYEKTRIIAEFLYTGINRGDLAGFWKDSIKNNVLPFVETPTIGGRCVYSYDSLNIGLENYVKDIYELSLLNLSLLYDLSIEEVKEWDLWYPPYGSTFPLACDKLTKAKSIFIDRTGMITICSGVPIYLGNINEENIEEKLSSSELIKKIRTVYNNLEGACSNCIYSKELQVCYGCRGNAYTRKETSQSMFIEDPLCFGIAASRLGKNKLSKIMSKNHLEKLSDSFNII